MTNYRTYTESTTRHWISNCGHDENNKYRGGKAGDQTGTEYQLKAWYNRPWTCVIRYPNPEVRMMIAQLAIDAALNNKIGYDQGARTSFWTQLARNSYQPSLITEPCEADCSSSTAAIIKAVGFLLDKPMLQLVSTNIYTGNMKFKLRYAGFIILTDDKYLTSPNYLLPGDILLYEGHHAAINVTRGAKSSKEGLDDTVVITGRSVYVRVGPGSSYASKAIVHAGDNFKYDGEKYWNNNSPWYRIIYNGGPAYVSGRYAKLV